MTNTRWIRDNGSIVDDTTDTLVDESGVALVDESGDELLDVLSSDGVEPTTSWVEG